MRSTRSRPPSRTRRHLALLAMSGVVTAVAVLAGLAGPAGLTGLAGDRPEPGPAAGPAPASPRGADQTAVSRPAVQAAAVLHAWDVRRAHAWSDGDLAGLRALYVPGSRAGKRDTSMLRAWLRRGLRVQGLSTQLLRVRVREHTPGRLVLSVTDRVAGFADAPGAAPVALPADLPTQRLVVLQRDAGRWRVAAVRA